MHFRRLAQAIGGHVTEEWSLWYICTIYMSGVRVSGGELSRLVLHNSFYMEVTLTRSNTKQMFRSTTVEQ